MRLRERVLESNTKQEMACNNENVAEDHREHGDEESEEILLSKLKSLHLSPIASSSRSEPDGLYTSQSISSDSERFSLPLPLCTSKWKIEDLGAVHIFYRKEFQTVTQILDMIHNETGMFGPATPKQEAYVEKLKDSMAFSISGTRTFKYELADVHLQLIMDRTEQEDTRTEDFIRCIKMMLRAAFSRCEDVSEAAFVDLFKAFVRLNGLLHFNDKDVRPQTKDIVLQQSISSECDIVLATEDYLKTDNLSTGVNLSTGQLIYIVSVVEVKNMQADIDRGEEKVLSSKSRPVRHQSRSSSNLDLEKSVHQEPAIYSRVKTNVLAQHGGELLLHSSIFRSEFKNTETLKHFYPGMIVVGTQVIFTVLEMNLDHRAEIKKSKVIESGRSYIHYSDPKDLLLKEDRDLLIESFARLSNKRDITLKPFKA